MTNMARQSVETGNITPAQDDFRHLLTLSARKGWTEA